MSKKHGNFFFIKVYFPVYLATTTLAYRIDSSFMPVSALSDSAFFAWIEAYETEINAG